LGNKLSACPYYASRSTPPRPQPPHPLTMPPNVKHSISHLTEIVSAAGKACSWLRLFSCRTSPCTKCLKAFSRSKCHHTCRYQSLLHAQTRSTLGINLQDRYQGCVLLHHHFGTCTRRAGLLFRRLKPAQHHRGRRGSQSRGHFAAAAQLIRLRSAGGFSVARDFR
jgi:hypothetical protein